MAVRSSKKTQSTSQVSPPLVAAAVVVLVLFLGGLIWYYFAPHSEAVHPRPLTAGETWLEQKARESGGDYNKLSPADKQQLFSITGPSGPVTLRMTYEAHAGKQ
jgi:hypothetical protein